CIPRTASWTSATATRKRSPLGSWSVSSSIVDAARPADKSGGETCDGHGFRGKLPKAFSSGSQERGQAPHASSDARIEVPNVGQVQKPFWPLLMTTLARKL